MSDDRSPGDARKPQSDQGARAGTEGSRPTPEEFARDIAPQTPQHVHQEHLEADSAADDKKVRNMLPELTEDELSRLPILDPGTPLEQGAVYFNLKDREKGPFKAIGGQEVGPKDKMIAKKMTDYELWNEIVGRDDSAEIQRPS